MSLLTARGSGKAKARNFTSKMEALISLLSEKGITIVPGSSPATDGVSKVYMPWLPDDATEEQYLKFFVSAAHEQSHFHGKSVVKDMPKDKLHHFCVNAVDDIRCERLQELAYPGIVEYRAKEYGIDCEGFLKKEFMAASRDNLKGLIVAALKYMIVLNRVHQMGVEAYVPVYASSDLIEVYSDHLQDLELTLDTISTFKESLEIGQIVYDRLKDIVKEELAPDKPEESDDGSEGSEGGEGDAGGDESKESSKGKSKSKGDDSSEDDDESTEEGEGDSSEDDKPEDEGTSDDGSEVDTSDEDTGDDTDGDTPEDSDEPEESESDPVEDFMAEMGEDDSGDLSTVADGYADDIRAIMKKFPGAYLSANGIKDIVEYGYENKDLGYGYLTRGKALLGTAGHKMTQLFVSQTRDRMLYAQRGGRMDMRALVCDPMDSRQDIYSRKIPGSLERSAVSFAVDNSGSMSTGKRINTAYEILAGILYYLDKAGIPTEAMGFTAESNRSSYHRDAPVIHTIIKEFHEPFKCKAVSRCHPPYRLAENIELEALRFLAPRLMERPERKILFVLSDGQPQFGVDAMNRKMAVAYTAYIKKLRTLGITVFGFGINCDLTQFFGEHCINTSTGNLGQEIVKKLTEILNK